MKIKHLHIKKFHQFRDFKLDLTYPAGLGDKSGQLLDKVCIVGQSGTGKTTLLKLIKSYMLPKTHSYVYGQNPGEYQHAMTLQMGRHEDMLYCNEYDSDIYSNQPNRWDRSNPEDQHYAQHYKPWMLYFPAETIEQVSQVMAADQGNPLDYFASNGQLNQRYLERKKQLENKLVYDFSTADSKDAWDAVLLKARAYRDSEIKKRLEISDVVMQDQDKISDAKQAFERWKAEHPSPFEELAAFLDPLLNHFNVQIKTQLDYERAEDLRFIQIQSTLEGDVPYAAWSTGTKQLVLTATPIFNTQTQFTTVLIDEPERSLYPDIQRILVDFYQKIGEGAQFIFATHSPFIAASFAPWEIFELEFDNEGYTRVVPYFEGERHVDNYKMNHAINDDFAVDWRKVCLGTS